MSEKSPIVSTEHSGSDRVETKLVIDTADMAAENAARIAAEAAGKPRIYTKAQKRQLGKMYAGAEQFTDPDLPNREFQGPEQLSGDTDGIVNQNAQAIFAAMDTHKENKTHNDAEAEDIKREIAFNETTFDNMPIFDTIRTSREYGIFQSDRDALVEKSKEHVKASMIETGLDVEQAQVALELRLDDIAAIDAEEQRQVAAGKEQYEAEAIATVKYDKIDERRKKFILDNNIRTVKGYDRARLDQEDSKNAVMSERTEKYKTFGEGYRVLESIDPTESAQSAAKKITEVWDKSSKAESPLLDKKSTEKVLATCFEASKNLIEGITPVHGMTKAEAEDNRDHKILLQTLDVLARSRGCEDEALIKAYIETEKLKIVEASLAYEDSKDMIVSSDEGAIKRYYNRYILPQGIMFGDFINHEDTAMIKAPVGFIVPANPLDSDAVSEGNPDPGENPLPPVDRTPVPRTPRTETTGTRAETKERRKKMAKKLRALGALALVTLGSGYAAGRVHENFMVKDKDTPVVDTLNKGQNNLRDADVSYEDQEEIGRNWGAAESLFSHNPDTAEQDMSNLQDAYETKLQEVVKNNPHATPDQASSMAKLMVEADMIAAPINN
jgi:hypothetical protein